MPSDECTFWAYAANPSPERQLMNSEWVSIVRVLAAQLSPKQQLVFTLRVLENVPIEEIESITNMNAAKIEQLIRCPTAYQLAHPHEQILYQRRDWILAKWNTRPCWRP